MKNIITILSFFLSLLEANENIRNFVSIDNGYMKYTVSNSLLKDVSMSSRISTFNYFVDTEKFQFYAGYKDLPYQQIGSAKVGSNAIDFFQRAYQYEMGIGRKFYISDDFFILPALLYVYNQQYNWQQLPNTTVTTQELDKDIRPYLYMRYRIAPPTYIYANIQLDNDLGSNKYETEYDQYPFQIALYQFLNNHIFLLLKYQQSLKDKPYKESTLSNENFRMVNFGVGYSF